MYPFSAPDNESLSELQTTEADYHDISRIADDADKDNRYYSSRPNISRFLVDSDCHENSDALGYRW